MSFLAPSQILELNIISGQDLAPVARYMKTYAVAWLDPERKLTTRVDNTGGTNPTWNDKFVFRLDKEALYDESSMLVVEIYALHWFKDIHIGTVQALISDLVSPMSAMRFVTLEVLRASGRPHGLLNIAVGLIDSSRQSMPLYTPSLFEEDLMFHQNTVSTKPVGLRRSRSDTSSMVEYSELSGMMRRNSAKNVEQRKEVITNSNLTSSSGFENSTSSEKNEFSSDSQMVVYQPPNKTPKTPSRPTDNRPVVPNHVVYGTPMRPRNMGYVPKKNNVEYGTPMRSRPTVITESELGPSASVVAALIAKERAMAGKEVESTVISIDERSVEGLQSKLERWQGNLPPVLDVGSSYQTSSDYKTSSNYKPTSKYKPNSAYKRNEAISGGGGRSVKHPMAVEPTKKHNRRHTDGGNSGLFSCFSKICGIECSIVCGGGGSGGAKGSKMMKKKQ